MIGSVTMIRRIAALLVITSLIAGCGPAPTPVGRAKEEPVQPSVGPPTETMKEPESGPNAAKAKLHALAERLGASERVNYDLPGSPIVHVDFSRTKITDADLAALAPLDTVQSLCFFYCEELSATGIKELSRFPNLEELCYPLNAGTRPGLKELKNFKKLKTLQFTAYGSKDDTKVTDADMKDIKGVKQLQVLHCPAYLLTDVGVKELKDLSELEVLDLVGSFAVNTGQNITDEGLTQLKALPKLRQLSLQDSRITDAGLKHIGQLQQLKKLDLSAFMSSKITDAGIKELEGLRGLESLDISGWRITDAGLKSIKSLTSLQTLRICNMPITDAGLSELKVCKTLKQIDVIGCKVTDAGVADTTKALPGVKITR